MLNERRGDKLRGSDKILLVKQIALPRYYTSLTPHALVSPQNDNCTETSPQYCGGDAGNPFCCPANCHCTDPGQQTCAANSPSGGECVPSLPPSTMGGKNASLGECGSHPQCSDNDCCCNQASQGSCICCDQPSAPVCASVNAPRHDECGGSSLPCCLEPSPGPPSPGPSPSPPGPHELDLHILDDDGNHCHELQALDNTTSCFTTYWGAHGYQFQGYIPGLCPAKFTSTDETNTVCANNVFAKIHGVLPPPPQHHVPCWD